MREALQKIDDLISLLEEKNKTAVVLNVQLEDKKKDLAELEEKAIAKLKHVSAMERVYKKYEDFDNEKKKFDAEKISFNKKIAEAQRQEDNDAETLKKIQEENKLLDARKLALDKQAIALKDKESAFKKQKDDMKNLLSGATIKEMLK